MVGRMPRVSWTIEPRTRRARCLPWRESSRAVVPHGLRSVSSEGSLYGTTSNRMKHALQTAVTRSRLAMSTMISRDSQTGQTWGNGDIAWGRGAIPVNRAGPARAQRATRPTQRGSAFRCRSRFAGGWWWYRRLGRKRRRPHRRDRLPYIPWRVQVRRTAWTPERRSAKPGGQPDMQGARRAARRPMAGRPKCGHPTFRLAVCSISKVLLRPPLPNKPCSAY